MSRECGTWTGLLEEICGYLQYHQSVILAHKRVLFSGHCFQAEGEVASISCILLCNPSHHAVELPCYKNNRSTQGLGLRTCMWLCLSERCGRNVVQGVLAKAKG